MKQAPTYSNQDSVLNDSHLCSTDSRMDAEYLQDNENPFHILYTQCQDNLNKFHLDKVFVQSEHRSYIQVGNAMVQKDQE